MRMLPSEPSVGSDRGAWRASNDDPDVSTTPCQPDGPFPSAVDRLACRVAGCACRYHISGARFVTSNAFVAPRPRSCEKPPLPVEDQLHAPRKQRKMSCP